MGNISFLSLLLGSTVLVAVVVIVRMRNYYVAYVKFQRFKSRWIQTSLPFVKCLIFNETVNSVQKNMQSKWVNKSSKYNEVVLGWYTDFARVVFDRLITSLYRIENFIDIGVTIQKGTTITICSSPIRDIKNRHSFMYQWDKVEEGCCEIENTELFELITLHMLNLLNNDLVLLLKNDCSLDILDDNLCRILDWSEKKSKPKLSIRRIAHGCVVDFITSNTSSIGRKITNEMHRLINTAPTGENGVHIVEVLEKLLTHSLFRFNVFNTQKVEIITKRDGALVSMFNAEPKDSEKHKILDRIETPSIKNTLLVKHAAY